MKLSENEMSKVSGGLMEETKEKKSAANALSPNAELLEIKEKGNDGKDKILSDNTPKYHRHPHGHGPVVVRHKNQGGIGPQIIVNQNNTEPTK